MTMQPNDPGTASPSTTPAERASRATTSRRAFWLLTAVTLSVFGPSLLGGFVGDDISLIVENHFAHSLEHVSRAFATDLWDVPSRSSGEQWAKFYRPVVTTSYAINWVLGGGQPWTFHLVNVLAHWGAVLLAFRLARRWTGGVGPALAATLVFAIHPTRTEPVIWISGRTDVFMALFLLLAVELAVAASRANAVRAGLLWLAAGAAWVLAVLSKEYALILPVLLAVEAALAFARSASKQERRSLVASVAAFVAGALLYVLLRSHYMPIRPDGLESPPVAMHAHYVLVTVGRYVMRALFPWPQVLMYRPIEVQGGHVQLPWFDTLVGALAVLAFSAALTMLAKRRRWVDVAVLVAAAIGFLPISNVGYTGFNSTTADRFFYLPLFLLALGALRPLRVGFEKTVRTRTRNAILGGALLICAAVAWVRTLDFTSNEAFWTQEVTVNPDVPMGWAVLSRIHAKRGDVREAYGAMRRAYAPAAQRYVLVAEPTAYYLALLSLKAALLPDGATKELGALADQLEALGTGHARRTRDVVGDLPLDVPVHDQNALLWIRTQQRRTAVEAAYVASRLGRTETVARMARSAGQQGGLSAANRRRLAIALLRVGLHEEADRQIALLGAQPNAGGPSTNRLRGDAQEVRKLRAAARDAPPADAALLRARAASSLAAWLIAARELRAAHIEHPEAHEVRNALLRALVRCRLEKAAYRVARQKHGHAEAVGRLAEIRNELGIAEDEEVAFEEEETWWE